MDNGTERPIEKALRAWAKKRREEAGAPPELHPATRRLLQAEVARQFGKRERQPRSLIELLAGLWPRVAWVCAIFAVLAVASWLVLPGLNRANNKASLASNDRRMLGGTPNDIDAPPAASSANGLASAKRPVEQHALAELESSQSTQSRESLDLGLTQRKPATSHALTLDWNPPTVAVAPSGVPRTKEEAKSALFDGSPAPASAAPTDETSTRRYGLQPNTATSPEAPTLAAPTKQFAVGGALKPPPIAGIQPPLAKRMPQQPGGAVTTDAANSTATDGLATPSTETAAKAEFAYKSAPAQAVPTPAARLASPKDTADYFTEDSNKTRAAGGPTIQRFTQVGLRADADLDKLTALKGILASFRVEQSGQGMRVVDNDGSVYTGYLQPVEALERLRWGDDQKSAAARALKAQEPPSVEKPALTDGAKQARNTYFFHVAGTNRSLKERVIFTGNLTALTNATLFLRMTNGPTGATFGLPTLPVEPTPLSTLPLIKSRISGRAVIGDRKEIEVNAVPAGP